MALPYLSTLTDASKINMSDIRQSVAGNSAANDFQISHKTPEIEKISKGKVVDMQKYRQQKQEQSISKIQAKNDMASSRQLADAANEKAIEKSQSSINPLVPLLNAINGTCSSMNGTLKSILFALNKQTDSLSKVLAKSNIGDSDEDSDLGKRDTKTKSRRDRARDRLRDRHQRQRDRVNPPGRLRRGLRAGKGKAGALLGLAGVLGLDNLLPEPIQDAIDIGSTTTDAATLAKGTSGATGGLGKVGQLGKIFGAVAAPLRIGLTLYENSDELLKTGKVDPVKQLEKAGSGLSDIFNPQDTEDDTGGFHIMKRLTGIANVSSGLTGAALGAGTQIGAGIQNIIPTDFSDSIVDGIVGMFGGETNADRQKKIDERQKEFEAKEKTRIEAEKKTNLDAVKKKENVESLTPDLPSEVNIKQPEGKPLSVVLTDDKGKPIISSLDQAIMSIPVTAPSSIPVTAPSSIPVTAPSSIPAANPPRLEDFQKEGVPSQVAIALYSAAKMKWDASQPKTAIPSNTIAPVPVQTSLSPTVENQTVSLSSPAISVAQIQAQALDNAVPSLPAPQSTQSQTSISSNRSSINQTIQNTASGVAGMAAVAGVPGASAVAGSIANPPNWKLGQTSKKYEVGKGGAGTVSSGAGDRGGISYGSYQMASNMGTPDKFVKHSAWSKEFEGMKSGTPEFTAKWKEIAAKDPSFGEAQHEYIKKTHYDPHLEGLKKSGIDLSGRGAAVQDMIWSTGVQFGGETSVVKKALKGKDVSKMSDEDIVSAVQDYKSSNNSNLFSKSSDNVRAGTLKRANQEKEDLIKLSKSVPASGQSVPTPVPASGQSVPTPVPASGQSVPTPVPASGQSVPTPVPASGQSVPASGQSVPTPVPASGQETDAERMASELLGISSNALQSAGENIAWATNQQNAIPERYKNNPRQSRKHSKIYWSVKRKKSQF